MGTSSTSKLTKLPALEIFTRLVPGIAAIVISPPGALMVPVLTTVPAINEIFCPSPTVKLPAFKITPGFAKSKVNWDGLPIKA